MSENQSDLPVATKTVLTATFTRQIQPRQYETASAGYTLVREFDGNLSTTEVDLLMANATYQLKTQVFAELGITAEVGEDGILVEIARTFPGTKVVAVDSDDDDDDEPRRPSRTNRGGGSSRSSGGSGKISSKDAEKMWKDFMGNRKADFYDNLDGEFPNIKHKKSGQKLYLKYAPEWVRDELDSDSEDDD